MIATYTYDALGRRMSKTVNGETKKFGYEGDNIILEMNDLDSVSANYTFGPSIDDPLMMNRNGEKYYYAKDGLGSVTALTDSMGNVVHEYKYSVFGKIVEETGENIDNQFMYTSRELDRETGLMFYHTRCYDPNIGRFISQDPASNEEETTNLYSYVYNCPINFIDPLGLNRWPVAGDPAVRSEFGPRKAPVPGATTDHKGIDIVLPKGESALASDDGVVISAGFGNKNGGNVVIVKNDKGGYSSYNHISPTVKERQRVSEGDEVGKSDGSGMGTAPHLHYSYQTDAFKFVNPREHLPALNKNGKPCP